MKHIKVSDETHSRLLVRRLETFEDVIKSLLNEHNERERKIEMNNEYKEDSPEQRVLNKFNTD